MWVPITLGVSAVALILLALRHRRSYLRELPVELWGRSFPDAGSVAREVERSTGLVASQLPAGLAWLGDFFLAPVWLFWGDLRTMRPVRRLARWRLDGALRSGRQAVIQLGPDETHFAVACRARAVFWAEAAAALESQEGLRGLHPVGSARWQAGCAGLEALFARGVLRLRLDDGRLRGAAPVEGKAPELAAYPALLEELEGLAALLERRQLGGGVD